MTLYHEAPTDTVDELLAEGLKRTSRGEKGDDATIMATDSYLDTHCPAELRAKGVRRDNNIYAFVGTSETLIDITNGATVPLGDYPLEETSLLRVHPDITACYVSDLDCYDAVKRTLANHETATLPTLAARYWAQLRPLATFTIGDIPRPEVMITTDLAPTQIERVTL